MNSRNCYRINEDDKLMITKMSEEHEQLFRKYIDVSAHYQEIMQLYDIMLFNLREVKKHFKFNFDDTVENVTGEKKVNIIEVNAVINNTISSAHTLIESIENYDKLYIPEEKSFKANNISVVFDKYFSYRFMYFIRNYMQHGHIPISYDGKKMYFQLSEILDAKQIKINSDLKRSLQYFENAIICNGEIEPRFAVVPVLYEYFLLVCKISYEFFVCIKENYLMYTEKIDYVLQHYPEYITNLAGNKYVGVYIDTYNGSHGFIYTENTEKNLNSWIQKTENNLKRYQDNNHVFILQIEYCLEEKLPKMYFVNDDALSRNLKDFCLEKGNDIRYLSYERYYGKMSMHTVYRRYPYIQFKDGIRWNVSYDDVTIEDFIRTFPETRKEGLRVYANNVGGADELFKYLMSQWSWYFDQAKNLLDMVGNMPIAKAVDWIGRIQVVYACIKLFRKSFSTKNTGKPMVKDLKCYIGKKNNWNILELQNNLHAEIELLDIVLRESGFICIDGVNYKYDKEIATKLENEREKEFKKKYDKHGTDLNCFSLNDAVDEINIQLLYYAILKKEQGKIEEYDYFTRKKLSSIKKYDKYIYWDDICKSLRIYDVFPNDFTQEIEDDILRLLYDIREKIEMEINKIEACIEM